jgi:hypothetical protein
MGAMGKKLSEVMMLERKEKDILLYFLFECICQNLSLFAFFV